MSTVDWLRTNKKESRCNGQTGSIPRFGFPQLCLNDAANGIRQTDNVTVFPDGITAGATWDKKLLYERGLAIGKEGRGKGVNIWLGPSVGPIGRKPKGGRNWEGFGSDPVLQAVGARETIRGVQSQGVSATVKHLIGNEQEVSLSICGILIGLPLTGLGERCTACTTHSNMATVPISVSIQFCTIEGLKMLTRRR